MDNQANIDPQMFKAIVKNVRETLLDKEKSYEFMSEYLDTIIPLDADDPDFEGDTTVRSMVQALSCRNIEIIHEYADSESEKLFLGALNLAALSKGPGDESLLRLVFLRPTKDDIKSVDDFREKNQFFADTRKGFIEQTGDKDTGVFVECLVGTGVISEEARDRYLQGLLVYEELGLQYAWHIIPQAKFPSIKIDGRSIRPDAYLFKPLSNDLNVIFECDGYDFHTDRKTFVSDRKRDRILNSKGFDVLRFSGFEIHHKYYEVAQEIIDYLEGEGEVAHVR